MSKRKHPLNDKWPKGDYWLIDVGKLDYQFKYASHKAVGEAVIRLAQLPIVYPKIRYHPELASLLRKRPQRRIKTYARLKTVIRQVLRKDEMLAKECISCPGSELKDYYFGFTYFRIRERKTWSPVIFFILVFLISRNKRTGRFIVGEAFARIGPEDFLFWPSD